MRRRMFLLTSLVGCVSLLSACAGIPTGEFETIGSKIYPTKLNFEEIYSYAKRANASYGPESEIKKQYPLVVRISSPGDSDTRYFLERDDKARTQTITVRGTNNNVNIGEDLDIKVRDDRKVDIPVHVGFDNTTRLIYQDIKPYLKAGYKNYVTGHSLGGAVAALLAVYMIEDGVPVARVITFGQPRFTTMDGVKRLGFLPLTRVVDEVDIVPLVPPGFLPHPVFGPFIHVGDEVMVLDGADYVYLPSVDATRLSFGAFWRMIAIAELADHDMSKYLARIAAKRNGANQVPYTDMRKHIF